MEFYRPFNTLTFACPHRECNHECVIGKMKEHVKNCKYSIRTYCHYECRMDLFYKFEYITHLTDFHRVPVFEGATAALAVNLFPPVAFDGKELVCTSEGLYLHGVALLKAFSMDFLTMAVESESMVWFYTILLGEPEQSENGEHFVPFTCKFELVPFEAIPTTPKVKLPKTLCYDWLRASCSEHKRKKKSDRRRFDSSKVGENDEDMMLNDEDMWFRQYKSGMDNVLNIKESFDTDYDMDSLFHLTKDELVDFASASGQYKLVVTIIEAKVLPPKEILENNIEELSQHLRQVEKEKQLEEIRKQLEQNPPEKEGEETIAPAKEGQAKDKEAEEATEEGTIAPTNEGEANEGEGKEGEPNATKANEAKGKRVRRFTEQENLILYENTAEKSDILDELEQDNWLTLHFKNVVPETPMDENPFS